MDEGDAFSFCADARYIVDESNSGLAALLESPVEIIDRKADMVNSGAAPRDEFSDRRVLAICLEQLDQRFARSDRRDARAVRIIDLGFLKAKDFGEKRNARRDRLHGDSDVRDSGPLGGFLVH